MNNPPKGYTRPRLGPCTPSENILLLKATLLWANRCLLRYHSAEAVAAHPDRCTKQEFNWGLALERYLYIWDLDGQELAELREYCK